MSPRRRPPLAQHQDHRALHVVALLYPRTACLGGDRPGSGNLQPGGPEHQRQVGPDLGVLVGEHHHLEAVVTHVSGGARVALGQDGAEAAPSPLTLRARMLSVYPPGNSRIRCLSYQARKNSESSS